MVDDKPHINMKYGKIINGKLAEYDGKSVINANNETRSGINVPDGMLRSMGYLPIIEDVRPELRYNQKLATYCDVIGTYIHVSFDVVEVPIPKEKIDAMKREAYEAESDHIYMQWQKYLATGDDRAEQTKIDWLAKVAEIQERYS